MMEMVALDGSRQRLDMVVVWLLRSLFFSATSVANFIWGPSRKLLGLRRRRRWHMVRAGVVPVPGPPGAQTAQVRDPFDLVILATRKSAFNAQILPWKCP